LWGCALTHCAVLKLKLNQCQWNSRLQDGMQAEAVLQRCVQQWREEGRMEAQQ
jgi:hypothetical protein